MIRVVLSLVLAGLVWDSSVAGALSQNVASDQWKPFIAKTRRTVEPNGEEAVGTIARHPDGSTRWEEADASKRTRLTIRSAPAARIFIRDCDGKWRSAPSGNRAQLVPPTGDVLTRPGTVATPGEYEGHRAVTLTRPADPSYTVTVIPDLNYLVVRRSEQGRSEHLSKSNSHRRLTSYSYRRRVRQSSNLTRSRL
jgi:hypothetical protein